ncbi:MAG TPA: HesA/MoeB/ThiF family protein [Labilithrix sp.]|nr:HesA/MoeB/ThiF family protein [Labilithrix sp.]
MSNRLVLAGSRVLVVGVGGLGCPAALALARAGVGTIGIADDDVVELTNLHRQILFRDEDVGKLKIEAAASALLRLVPDLRIERHLTRMLPQNAVELASRYDVILEGSDNFPTKFLAADASRIARKPIVHAAAVGWHGTALAVGPSGGPCYRCLFEDLPQGSAAASCADAGVVGPMVGVVAAVQADLALSVLRGEAVFGTLFTFDGKTLESRRRILPRRAGCALCSDPRSIERIDPNRYAVRQL